MRRRPGVEDGRPADAPPVPPPAEAARRQAEAQPAVLLELAQGARTCRGARQRAAGAGSVVRRSPSESDGAPRSPEPAAPQPPNFDDAWPKSGSRKAWRSAAPARAGPAAPSTLQRRRPHTPAREDAPQVTVLKSGVVDGMAYSLYSDGSIEAQMPEGMMRFASIDELRAHLDQRP